MSSFSFEYPPGATPLDPNEIDGLIPKYISTQSELNLLEQQNILEAQEWLVKKRKNEILNDTFIRDLHKKMFKNVWKWAGTYRKAGKNIGVSWEKIPEELRKLCEDVKYWVTNKSYSWDELGARFHHRLVAIHAFSNGNGRHARLMTDVLLESNGQDAFSWGQRQYEAQIAEDKKVRELYITALREADQRKFEKLVAFVRS